MIKKTIIKTSQYLIFNILAVKIGKKILPKFIPAGSLIVLSEFIWNFYKKYKK